MLQSTLVRLILVCGFRRPILGPDSKRPVSMGQQPRNSTGFWVKFPEFPKVREAKTDSHTLSLACTSSPTQAGFANGTPPGAHGKCRFHSSRLQLRQLHLNLWCHHPRTILTPITPKNSDDCYCCLTAAPIPKPLNSESLKPLNPNTQLKPSNPKPEKTKPRNPEQHPNLFLAVATSPGWPTSLAESMSAAAVRKARCQHSLLDWGLGFRACFGFRV